MSIKCKICDAMLEADVGGPEETYWCLPTRHYVICHIKSKPTLAQYHIGKYILTHFFRPKASEVWVANNFIGEISLKFNDLFGKTLIKNKKFKDLEYKIDTLLNFQ